MKEKTITLRYTECYCLLIHFPGVSRLSLNRQNESEYIVRAQNGDKQAFGELALFYRKNICGLACRIIGNLDEAEDIAQNVFIRAFLALPRFTPKHDGSLKAWLLTITSRLCLDYLRRCKKQQIYLEGISYQNIDRVAADNNIVDIVVDSEEKKILCQALLQLPPNYRMAIALKYIEELDYQEISQVMKVPLGTVGTWIRRGLAELRTDLNRKGDEHGAKLATR